MKKPFDAIYCYAHNKIKTIKMDGELLVIEWSDGAKVWYLNGKLHRTDGPAVERADGSKSWYLNGKQLSERKWKEMIRTKNVDENTTAVTTVTATDVDASTTLTYSISGGADQALFTIDAATGLLTFISARDFENPTDADGNNVYEVTITVSDGSLNDVQAISVNVININDAPTDIYLTNDHIDEGLPGNTYI